MSIHFYIAKWRLCQKLRDRCCRRNSIFKEHKAGRFSFQAFAGILMFGLLTLPVPSPLLYAGTPSVDRAVSFLVENQDGDTGVWSTGTSREIIDSLEAIRALLSVEEINGSITTDQLLLNVSELPSNSPLTTQIMALHLELYDDVFLVKLFNARNTDGGWGAVLGKQSNPLDTVIAVDALLSYGGSPVGGWEPTVNYLLACRNRNGFWSLSDESASSELALTARVVRTLKSLENHAEDQTTRVQTTISSALALLRGTLQTDGRFSFSANLIESIAYVDTAEVYRTLILFDPPALYRDTLSLLINEQNPNGSWVEASGVKEEEVYTTAVVLQTLTAIKLPPLSPRADLTVFSSSISSRPANPSPGATIDIKAIIFNIGDNVAQSITAQFFIGDPRSGGRQIGTEQIIPAISPNGSGIASTQLDTSGLTESPLVFVQVDSKNKIPELDISNNIASRLLHIDGLPDASGVDGPDLFISTEFITFNNEHTNTVFLTGSPTIIVDVTIANLGNQPAAAFKVKVRDSSSRIANVTVSALDANSYTTVRIPWTPVSGSHEITAVIDVHNVITESNEFNNMANMAVEIIGSTVAIFAKKFKDGAEIDPPYRAYDTGRFVVATAYQDVDIAVNVKNNSTGQRSKIKVQKSVEGGRYQWNVVNHAPGNYVATAIFSAAETGAYLDSAATQFEILPTIHLRSLRALVERNVIEGGDISPTDIMVLLENGSNIASEWRLTWEVLAPDGEVVLTSTVPQVVPILADQTSVSLTLDEPITGRLTQQGRYTIVVTAGNAESDSLTTKTFFNILPIFKVNVVNKVVPSELSPLDRARTTTLLKVTAARDDVNLDLPVAIRSLAVIPAETITDSNFSKATIKASGVVNALGELVPDGTKLLVYTPYGDIVGGMEPPPSIVDPVGSPPNPQIKLFEVRDGAVVIHYIPRGNTLGENQNSLSVIQFHQFLSHETQWFGKNIANTEIFLAGDH